MNKIGVGMMTLDEKIHQIFWVLENLDNNQTVQYKHSIGGVMFRANSEENIRIAINEIKLKNKISPFISANCESGINGVITMQQPTATHRQLGTVNNENITDRFASLTAKKMKDIGLNVNFSPIVDVQFNPENPMTLTRCFSDKVDIVKFHGAIVVNSYLKNGIFPVLKHFGGDGTTATDQHTTLISNDFDKDEWESSYGDIYQTLINLDVPIIMAGHIKLSFVDSINPCSTSKSVIQGYLREKLKFKGLVITDSTLMAGFTTITCRKRAIVDALNAGVDMILFNRNFDEDFNTVKEAVTNGEISECLIDEKVNRILNVKEGLTEQNQPFTNRDESELFDLTEIIARDAIEIIDRQNLLPLSRVSNVLLIPFLDIKGRMDSNYIDQFKYEFLLKSPETSFLTVKDVENVSSIEAFKNKVDLVIYLIGKDVRSNRNITRFEYQREDGLDTPWFINEVETMLISLVNPYHDRDLVNIRTVINLNSSSIPAMRACIEKIMNEERE